MILGGCPELNAIEWRCVIIDEAHRLKNKNCKLLEGLKLMNLVSNFYFTSVVWFYLFPVQIVMYDMMINHKLAYLSKRGLEQSFYANTCSWCSLWMPVFLKPDTGMFLMEKKVWKALTVSSLFLMILLYTLFRLQCWLHLRWSL